MKKNTFLLLMSLLLALSTFARREPFQGAFYNKECRIRMELNLYDTLLVVPDYEFLGKTNGYIRGDLHEVWFLTTYKIEKGCAIVHFTNEMGADTQELILTPLDSLHLQCEVQGSNYLRKLENRKWVKLPQKMVFLRIVSPPKSQPVPQRFRKY